MNRWMQRFKKIFKISAKWKDIEYFNDKWKIRVAEMSQYIKSSEQSVLDLGCGMMRLKEYLHENCLYYACDYKQRNGDTIICDFNKKEFPDIHVDVCFVSGCMEYVEDTEWFLEKIQEYSNALILSYCTMDHNHHVILRKKNAWVNHYYEKDIIAMAQKHGFFLSNQNRNVSGNPIFRFDKVKPNNFSA